MPDIWVDPLLGNDSNTGLTRAQAKATIAAAYAQTTIGATLHLCGGNYINQINRMNAYKTITWQAEGTARIIATEGSGITHGIYIDAVNNQTITMKGLQWEGYQKPIGTVLTNVFKLYNMAFWQSSKVSGSYCFSIGEAYLPGPQYPHLYLRMENCTVYNYDAIFLNGSGPDSHGYIDLEYARNNLFVNYNNFCIMQGHGQWGRYFNATYGGWNAYSSAVFNPTSGGYFIWNIMPDIDSVYSTTPVFVGAESDPPDLRLDVTSVDNAALLVGGQYGMTMGALCGAGMRAGESAISGLLPTDWTNWSNDDLWYDTVSDVVGPDGELGCSPVILTGASPRVWVLSPLKGSRVSGRILGPVYDFGESVDFSRVVWAANEQGTNNVVANITPYSAADGPKIEVRYSNTAFARTDALPNTWTAVGRKETPALTGRYWQPRIVLRTNAAQS